MDAMDAGMFWKWAIPNLTFDHFDREYDDVATKMGGLPSDFYHRSQWAMTSTANC